MKKIFIKKILYRVFLIAFVSIFSYGTVSAASFPDVPENNTYYAPVEYLKAKGILVGYPDGTFRPGQTIRRDEALKVAMMASGIDPQSTQEISFPDVKPTDWSYQHIRKAVQRGIVEGYQDGTFKPANSITVNESSKVILLSFALDVGQPPTANPYSDVDAVSWPARYVQYLKTKGFFGPQGDGLFHGERDITRGEFVQIIYRLMYTDEKHLETFPLSTDWPTTEDSCKGYRVKYPFDWKNLKADDGTSIFWKQDMGNNQQSWARLTPNSAIASIVLDTNKDKNSLAEYIGAKVYTKGAEIKQQTLNNYPFTAVIFTSLGITDYYFELPNHTILIIYTQLGSGAYASYLAEEIRYLVGSIRDIPLAATDSPDCIGTGTKGTTSPLTHDQLMSQLNGFILMQGQGQKALDLLSDELIVETDTLGIGTGPVDYYYSTQYDTSLKYERNSKTLLAIKAGKTTAF